MEHEYVTITKKEHDFLKSESDKLTCLENAGVDNWDGYDDAMEEYRNKED